MLYQRPQAQRLAERAQQAQALHDAGRNEDDGALARDSEAPKQSPVTDLGRPRPQASRPACGRVSDTSAVVSVWMAAKFSALMRSARKRMPVSVADISEARCT